MFWKNSDKELHPLEVNVAQTVAALGDEVTQIVDCREPDEWEAAHLDNTTLIPLDSLQFRIGELDPERPVIVVCRSGKRSLMAVALLEAHGFRDAKSLAGGLIAWVEAGHPVVQRNDR